jgi:NitT/TauT family transport system ATP-binding protein
VTESPTQNPLIELRDVCVTYRGVKRETHALTDVSLTVDAGESVALIGPSGCGKTTILNLIAGLLKPDAGTVVVDSMVLEKPRRQTSLILQDYGLLPWKTTIDNAGLGLTLRDMKRAQAREHALEALCTVGLADFAHAYPSELSGGMRQRLALARAIALNADIMLMDEPLSALDALTREELQDLLLDLQSERGYAQVLVTHAIEEAVFLGRRIVLMTPHPGRVHAIIENPESGDRDYRETPAFYQRCADLRSLLVAQERAVDA